MHRFIAAAAGISVLMLAGCSGEVTISAPEQEPEQTATFTEDHREDIMGVGVIKIPDGRFIVCASRGNLSESDLTCDWEGATQDEVVIADGIGLISTTITTPQGDEVPCIMKSHLSSAGVTCDW